MTTLQKTVVTATVAVLAGLGIYEARRASQLREQVQTLQQQQTPMTEQMQQLKRERDDAATQLARFQTENEQLKSNQNTTELLRLRAEIARLRADAAEKENDLIESGMAELATRINQTRQWLEQTSAEKIPELDFIDIQDWVNYVGSVVKWQGTTNDFNFVLGMLRTSAKRKLAPKLVEALADYLIANDGRLPNELSQLKPYLASLVEAANRQGYRTPQITDAMLQRYELLHVGHLSDFPETEMFVAEKALLQNAQYDARFRIGAFGYSYKMTHQFGESGSGGAPSLPVAEKLRAFYKK